MIRRLEKRCDAIVKRLIRKKLTDREYDEAINTLHTLEYKIYKLKLKSKII